MYLIPLSLRFSCSTVQLLLYTYNFQEIPFERTGLVIMLSVRALTMFQMLMVLGSFNKHSVSSFSVLTHSISFSSSVDMVSNCPKKNEGEIKQGGWVYGLSSLLIRQKKEKRKKKLPFGKSILSGL